MGVSSLMSLGVRAMAANYAGLHTTGNNIANANVDGYSRQQVNLATSQGQYSGGGFFGHGVDVVSVTRAHDEFLTRESANAKSLSAMDRARLTQLQDMESIFKTGEQGLGDAATQLFSALSDLSSHPADSSARQVVLARAEDMATRFRQAGTELDTVQQGVSDAIITTVADINRLTQGIASANQRISALRGLGQPANDLLDERDRLIAMLSEKIQVTRVDAGDGTTSLFAGGGQRLVLGFDASTLLAMRDPADASRLAVGMAGGPTPRTMDDAALGGGAVAGLLRFQNHDLVQGRNLVGRMATAVGMAVNSQQERGLSLQPPLGSQKGSPLFALGAAQALPNGGNARDASGNPLGNVALTISDASALQPSDYDLRESPSVAGAWQLTRLSDGKVSTVNSGDVVDGMRMVLANPQPGDRYLLQPVARAAIGMASLLSDPRDVAAASPLLATTAAANTGSVHVASLQVTAATLPVPGGSTQISFTDNAGHYSWTQLDASGVNVGSGSGTWTAGQPVPTPPVDINGFSLRLDGVPKSGDVVNVAPTPASAVASNNGNALALTALRDAALIDGRSSTDGWAQAMSSVGVRVQSAQTASAISTAVTDQTELARSAQSGVSLDEEAAKLIQYQQSYQAAAKMLQVAQSLFDTLLQTTAR